MRKEKERKRESAKERRNVNKMNKNKRGKNKKLYEDELKCKVGNRKEGEGEE